MPGLGPSTAARVTRRSPARTGLVLVAATWLIAGMLAAPARAATTTWQVAASPDAIDVGETATIKVTFSNLGGRQGNDDLGCVTLVIPAEFKVSTAVVSNAPAGTSWLAVPSGQTTIMVTAAKGGDRLPPDGLASVTVATEVTSSEPGGYLWTATAFRSQNCKDPFDDVGTLAVAVLRKATPVPVQTPSPTTRPTATPTPAATARPTLDPTATPTSVLAASPSPARTAKPVVTPAPTDDPAAAPSSSPAPARSRAPTAPVGSDRSSPSDPPIGAAFTMPGDGGGTDGSTGTPTITLTSAFATPFGDGFAWAVPGLVLSAPGLLLVLVIIVAQAIGAFAWLPVVRQRIGGFGIRRRA